eukprot:1145349-Pelagomonas_calceolata.AAC.15
MEGWMDGWVDGYCRLQEAGELCLLRAPTLSLFGYDKSAKSVILVGSSSWSLLTMESFMPCLPVCRDM